MKKTVYSLLAIAIIAIACGKKEEGPVSGDAGIESIPQEAVASGESPIVAGDSISADTQTKAVIPTADFSTNGIVAAYLKLQGALANDDSKSAAQEGKALYGEFEKVYAIAVGDKRPDYLDIATSAKELAEKISREGADIARQREYFALLSKHMSDLVGRFGTNRKLYLDHCPMYDGGKGATWLSATKEIRNPYYGEEMLSCGSVQKEL